MSMELITIEPKTALTVFTTPGGLEPFIEMVRKEVEAFEPDISTAKGRKEVASFAFRVKKVRTYLDGAGKTLNDEQKEIPKKIDAARRDMREKLEALEAAARGPLTEWEEKETARVNAHKAAIAQLTSHHNAALYPLNMPLDEMRQALADAEAVKIGPACEEFEGEYAKARQLAIASLTEAIATREQHDANQAELAELRKQSEARAQKDREEQIAREAAEKARADAEAKAAAERQAAARREHALEQARLNAERRALEAEETAKRKVEQARVAEQLEAAAKAKDADHRKAVAKAAFAGLTSNGIEKETAIAVLRLIDTGKVPHVSINYGGLA